MTIPPVLLVPAALKAASAHALALMPSPVHPEEGRLDVRRASKTPQRIASSRSGSLAKKHSVASAALVALFLRQRLEPHVGMRTP